MNQKDLAGLKFGRLTALERTAQKKGNCFLWRCKCDCGSETLATTFALTHEAKRSCGCLQVESRKNDLTGQRFGRLTAIRPTKQKMHTCIVWECRCDCGLTVYVRSDNLTQGETRSCGCLKDEQTLQNSRGMHLVNLRDGTNIKRIQSDKMPSHNTSGTKGVSWHNRLKKWQARLSFRGKTYHLGYFDNIDDAAKARQAAEKKYFGEYLENLNKGEN